MVKKGKIVAIFDEEPGSTDFPKILGIGVAVDKSPTNGDSTIVLDSFMVTKGGDCIPNLAEYRDADLVEIADSTDDVLYDIKEFLENSDK